MARKVKMLYQGTYHELPDGMGDELMRRVVEIANSGHYEYVKIGQWYPKWFLVGPAIPIMFEQE